MTNYITDKFNKFVFSSVKKLHTNDDLYDECNRCIEASRKAPKLEQLINGVAYAEIAYGFRLKKLEASEETHGSYYNSYYQPVVDAAHQVGCARDRLMEYCWNNGINYLEQLQ